MVKNFHGKGHTPVDIEEVKRFNSGSATSILPKRTGTGGRPSEPSW